MTDTITEARELLATDALVAAAEYKRVIQELLGQIDALKALLWEEQK